MKRPRFSIPQVRNVPFKRLSFVINRHNLMCRRGDQNAADDSKIFRRRVQGFRRRVQRFHRRHGNAADANSYHIHSNYTRTLTTQHIRGRKRTRTRTRTRTHTHTHTHTNTNTNTNTHTHTHTHTHTRRSHCFLKQMMSANIDELDNSCVLYPYVTRADQSPSRKYRSFHGKINDLNTRQGARRHRQGPLRAAGICAGSGPLLLPGRSTTP